MIARLLSRSRLAIPHLPDKLAGGSWRDDKVLAIQTSAPVGQADRGRRKADEPTGGDGALSSCIALYTHEHV